MPGLSKLESFPVEVQRSIFGFATLSFATPSADSPPFDHLALTCHSASNRETKLALCLTSRTIRWVAGELLFRYVALTERGVAKVAARIRDGLFDATLVRELRLEHRGVVFSLPPATLSDVGEVVRACTSLTALDLSAFFRYWGMREVELDADRLNGLWSGISPRLQTMCVGRLCHIPFLHDSASLDSFVAGHPQLRNWKISSMVSFDRPEVLRLFANTKLLSLHGFLRSTQTDVALSGVTALVLYGFHAGVERFRFPDLTELTFGQLGRQGAGSLDAILCASPLLRTLTCKVGFGDWHAERLCWNIHPHTSGLEQVVLHIEVEVLVDSLWIPHLFPLQAARPGADARQTFVLERMEGRRARARALLSGLTNRASFPRMRSITVVRSWGPRRHPVTRAGRMRKVYEDMLSFLATDHVQLLFASGSPDFAM
ncbi:hypothetical protein SCHPADRAFT_948149 [Schizopora paradoxa]|uniref:Uncharacterized protein n=1 Tax=Schizopora paradoxa TaxID=27342 RepID=A0A0H2R3D3_9AGAM|nr:hypothetical protein SCHPADRAFT_948149 [Schizopora paradoxa]